VTLTLVIDGTQRYEVHWQRGADDLRQQIRTWIEGNQRTVLTLADGETMLVNWPAVQTAVVREG